LIVENIANRNVVYVAVPGTRDEVLDVMRRYNISVVPVVKKGTKTLVGIITHRDLMEKPDETQLALLMKRDPMTISKNATLKELVELMLKNNIFHLPVTENEKTLVGLVSLSDIVRKAITVEKETVTIRPFVRHVIIAVWEETPLPVAYMMMKLAKATVLHVLDDKGKLVGVIDESDFLKASEVISEEKISSIPSTGEGTDWSWDVSSIFYIMTKRLNLPEKPVKEVMTKDVITVSEHATLSECALKMMKFDLDQLPVKNAKGELVGVINELDLVRGYYETVLSKRNG